MVVAVSCGTTSSLAVKNSATYTNGAAELFVTPVLADLKVSSAKITYTMSINDEVGHFGMNNIIATAVKEALKAYGADVLVGMETSVIYKSDVATSITITGFPANYVNFRSADGSCSGEKVGIQATGLNTKIKK